MAPTVGDKPAKGNIGSVMADVVSLKSSESASTTKFLREIRHLVYIRQPALHNAG